jgi:hypothetical protein
MLVVACVGMMVYAVAGAAPDGTELAPASCGATPTTSCAQVAAAKSGDKDSPPTTDKGDKTTQTTGKDRCDGSSTPGKDDGKDDSKDTTSTTAKGGKDDSKDTTSTTAKGGKDDSKDTTSTTAKGGKDDSKDTTSTTATDGKDDSGSTPTTSKDGTDDSKNPTSKDVSTTAAVKGGDSTTDKGDSAGKDDCEPTKGGGKDTTDTTRKGGGKTDDKDTTTTTDRRDRPTTSTTDKQDSVKPTTPSGGGDPGSGGTDSPSSDPGATPIEPQEAPPDASAEPEATDGDYSDMPDEGPVAWDEDDVAIGPMAAPGEAAPVLPTFNGGFYDGSGWKAPAPAKNRPSRSSGKPQQLAAPPLVMSSSGSVEASSAVSESAAVSRTLAGNQTSATESAFPSTVISTPKVFPINRRDPLAAAALVLLAGVSRELFKAWRRQANAYWSA